MHKIRTFMIWIFGILLGFVATGAFVAWSLSAPRYTGQKSDHFDGERFINPDNIEAKGLGDLLKWALNRQKGTWNMHMEAPQYPIPTSSVDTGRIRITFVNHSTFLVQCSGINILTDPIWSDRASPFQWAGPHRVRPPGVAFEALPPIHAVIISHNHYDHLDVPTLKRLGRTFHPKFYVPLGVGSFLEELDLHNVQELDWWQQANIEVGVSLTAVPANHFSGRGSADRDATLWCGYVIGTHSGNVYFAGDTGYGTFFPKIAQQCGPIDVAMLPIGAYKPRWFMSPIHASPQEAVAIHEDMRAKYSIGMHLGTFPLADDGEQDPLIDLQAALREREIADGRFMVLQEGRFFEYVKGIEVVK